MKDKKSENEKLEKSENEFDSLCYKVFVLNEDGKMLMEVLKANFVNQPFSSIPPCKLTHHEQTSDRIMFKCGQRDLVQRLMQSAYIYEFQLKTSIQARQSKKDNDEQNKN